MSGYPVHEATLLSVFIFIISQGLKTFPDTFVFDKRPFSLPNATIAIFYTIAEKPLGSSNLKTKVVNN
jgi:hypothetical protein